MAMPQPTLVDLGTPSGERSLKYREVDYLPVSVSPEDPLRVSKGDLGMIGVPPVVTNPSGTVPFTDLKDGK